MATKDQQTRRLPAKGRALAHAAALACGLYLLGGSADASAIRRHQIHAAAAFSNEASLGPAWQKFLSGGPTLWAFEKPPRFPSNLLLTTDNGVVVATPFVDYLEWRRSLNPARFDHYHPRIANALAQFLTPPTPITTLTATPTAASPTGTPRSATQGDTTTMPQTTQFQNTVPEPGAFAATFTLFGLGLWWRARLRRSFETSK